MVEYYKSKSSGNVIKRSSSQSAPKGDWEKVSKPKRSSSSTGSTKSSFESRVEQAIAKGATGVVVSGSKAIGVAPQRIEQIVLPGGGGIEEIKEFDRSGNIVSIETRIPDKLIPTGVDKRAIPSIIGVPKIREAVKVNLDTRTGLESTQRFVTVGDKKISLTPESARLLGTPLAPIRGRVLKEQKETFDIKDKRKLETRYSQLVLNIGKAINTSKPIKFVEKQITELDKIARQGGAKFRLDQTALAKGQLNFIRTKGRRTTGGAALAEIGAGASKAGLSFVKAIVKTVTNIQAALAYTTIVVASSSLAENKKFIKDPIGYTKNVANTSKIIGTGLFEAYKTAAPIVNVNIARFLALPSKQKLNLIKTGVVVGGTYISIKAAKTLLGGRGAENIGEFIGESVVFNKLLSGLVKLYKTKGVFKAGSLEKKAISKFSRSVKPFPKPVKKLTPKELLREIKRREKILRQLAKDKDTISIERGLVKLKRGFRKLSRKQFMANDEKLRLAKQLVREESKLKKLALKAIRQDKKGPIKGLETRRVVGKRLKARKKEIGLELKTKQAEALAKAEKEGAGFWKDLVTYDKVDRKIFTLSELDKQRRAFKKLYIFTSNRVERDALALYVKSRKSYSFKTLNRFTKKYKSILAKGKVKEFRSSILDNAIKESKLAKGKVPLTATAARPKPLKQSGLTKPKEKQAKKAYKELKDIIGKETAKGGQLQKDGQVLLLKVEQTQKKIVSSVKQIQKQAVKSKTAKLRAKLKRLNKLIDKLQKQSKIAKVKYSLILKLTSKFRKTSLLLAAAAKLLKQKPKQLQGFNQLLKLKEVVIQDKRMAQKLKLELKQIISEKIKQDQSLAKKQLQELAQSLKQELKQKAKTLTKLKEPVLEDKVKTLRLNLKKLTFDTKPPRGKNLMVTAYVAIKGRRIRVVKGLPLNRAFRQAFTRGSKLYRGVDKSTPQSFEFRIVGFTSAKDIKKPKEWSKVRQKLSNSKKVLSLVEKRKHAIDSQGEKRGLKISRKRKR